MSEQPQALVSFWIEFDEWPADLRFQRVPPYPRDCGVTGADLDDALDLIHRGFYEERELPPVLQVSSNVDRAPGDWAGTGDIPKPTGKRGIWWPSPFHPERTLTA